MANVSLQLRAALRSAARAFVVLCIGLGPSWVSAAELRFDDESRSSAPLTVAQPRAADPSSAGASAKRTCLVLENTVIIDGAAQKAYGMICAGKDGVWRLVPF